MSEASISIPMTELQDWSGARKLANSIHTAIQGT